MYPDHSPLPGRYLLSGIFHSPDRSILHSGNRVRCSHRRCRLCSRSHSLKHCFRGYWSLRSRHIRRKVLPLYPYSGCWKCCPGCLWYTGNPDKRLLFRLFRLLSVLHRSHCLPVRTGSGSTSPRYLLRLYRIPCRLRRSSSSLLRLPSSGCAVRLHCTGFPVSGWQSHCRMYRSSSLQLPYLSDFPHHRCSPRCLPSLYRSLWSGFRWHHTHKKCHSLRYFLWLSLPLRAGSDHCSYTLSPLHLWLSLCGFLQNRSCKS